MKALKYIGITLAAILMLILVIALFVSRNVRYEKSISINAPIDSVWLHINTLEEIDQFTPWNDYEPNMKKSMSGVDGTVGAVSSWESEMEDVGKGTQTISKIEAPTLIATDLKFFVPYESEVKTFVKLTPEESGTKVTWVFESEIPYPFNIIKLWMGMDNVISEDGKNRPDKLKAVCEK